MIKSDTPVFSKGIATEKEEIIDFLNLVFSQSHYPHDFKKLAPKAYSENINGLGAEHYLAKKDGKIKAIVANRIIDVNFYGNVLKVGLIGNVSVHPYSRGEGFMTTLMNNAIDDAKNLGVDILMLGGQRQRYQYFGFENGGYRLRFSVDNRNVKHCLSDLDVSNIDFKNLCSDEEIDIAYKLYNNRSVRALRSREEFFYVLKSGDNVVRSVYNKNEMIGYVVGNFEEAVFVDEKFYPLALKAFFCKFVKEEVFINLAPHEKDRISFLQDICQDYQLCHFEMLNVLNWEKVLSAAFLLKSKMSTLADGEICVEIDGQNYKIVVNSGQTKVTKEKDCKVYEKLNHLQAHRRFFELKNLYEENSCYKNWLPLPLFIDAPDTF